jgi:4-hydroxybenzoate polyprenyltransferase
MIAAEGTEALELSSSRTGRSLAMAAFLAMRPQQWTKNLLLFAGIVFAAEIGDISRWLQAGAAFLAFSAASSAAYLVNDVLDADSDRLHPLKRLRPIASGELSARLALALAAGLVVLAAGLIATTGVESALMLLAFLVLQAAYSLGLKRVVLFDVGVIAGLFVIRAAAGAAAVEVRISPWLLLCTALLSFFLGFAKRRGELVLVGRDETPGRSTLDGYSLPLLDQLLTVAASSAIVAYAIYTFTARDSKAMMLTIPFVVLGVFRYLLLVNSEDLGEEPERVLLGDLPILLIVAGWTVSSALILYLT